MIKARTLTQRKVQNLRLAAYAQIVRKRIQMSWSELAALAASQFVLAAAALGIVGLFAPAIAFLRAK